MADSLTSASPSTGLGNNGADSVDIQRRFAAVSLNDINPFRRCLRLGGERTLAARSCRPCLSVDHVVARNLVFSAAHECQFHLILDIFNMERAARGHSALEGLYDFTVKSATIS